MHNFVLDIGILLLVVSLFELVKIHASFLAIHDLDLGLGPYNLGHYKNTLEEQM